MSKGKTKQVNRKSRNAKPRSAGFQGVSPSKSLGQNFLIDQEVISAIIDGSEISAESLVIEIGPGTGALTLPLAKRAGRVIAIELDERLIQGLRVKTFEYGNVEIINEDILKVDLASMVAEAKDKYGLQDVRIVGNLPYYITTPIIMKLLESNTGATSITAMMQKEVGDRIAAEPGTKLAGAITYSVYYYASVDKIVDADRECFYPSPKVDSVVLRLDLRTEPPVRVRNLDFFFKCVKAGFMQRRKTLLNSLMTIGNMNKETLKQALDAAEIAGDRRAESLSMEEFARLADYLLST